MWPSACRPASSRSGPAARDAARTTHPTSTSTSGRSGLPRRYLPGRRWRVLPGLLDPAQRSALTDELARAGRRGVAQQLLERRERPGIQTLRHIGAHQVERFLPRVGRPVGPVGNQRLVDIGDGQDAHRHGQRVTGQAPWVPAAVEALVVSAGHRGELYEARYPADDLLGEQWMLAEPGALVFRERSRLIKNSTRDRQLA